MEPIPDLSALSLADIARLAEEQKLPPVERWNPTHCGDSEMRIARDGTWFHQGSPIGRQAMVRLFSTILRKDPGRYVLVTPVERVGITVEDVPFIAVEMRVEGSGAARALSFRTTVDDWTTAGPQHPMRFELEPTGGLRPYVLVRGDLWARVSRAVFYDLVALGEDADTPDGRKFGVRSCGVFFPLADAGDLAGDLAGDPGEPT
jgi:hypothetical protein